MFQKQLSVFIENKRGKLASITKILGDNGIDIGALSIADTKDYGILRVIVDKPEQAEKILKDAGYAVSITDVIAISVDDAPGGLAGALHIFEEKGINIEYMYHYARKDRDKASMIIRVEGTDEALAKIRDTSINLLSKVELNGG